MYEDLCFDAQQAAEKCLKGLLIYLGKKPPRTHSIGHLFNVLKRGCKIGTDLVFGSYGAVDTLLLPGTTIYYVNQSPTALGASVGKLVKRRLNDPEAEAVCDVVKQPVLVQRL